LQQDALLFFAAQLTEVAKKAAEVLVQLSSVVMEFAQ
jgi:hypothetical protein